MTGATRGIGKQIADDLCELGAKVICTGTKQDEVEHLNQTTSEFKRYVAVDFSDKASTDRFVAFLNSLNHIDVCINNAGSTNVAPIDEASEQEWDKLMSVNLKAPFLITRIVSRLMKAGSGGRIVNISSIWGHVSYFDRPIMSASKFGLRGLTVATANDLAAHGVLVNDVAPGWTLTDLVQKSITKETMSEISKRIPVGHFAKPKDISRVVLFLASELNTYITGQSVVVDGGYTNL